VEFLVTGLLDKKKILDKANRYEDHKNPMDPQTDGYRVLRLIPVDVWLFL
jgi:hypothetical protein